MNPTPPFNLMGWIEEHSEDFKPPVMNKQFYKEANDVIVFVSKGPNNRNDYHVNPTEELFYQLKGLLVVFHERERELENPMDQIHVARLSQSRRLPQRHLLSLRRTRSLPTLIPEEPNNDSRASQRQPRSKENLCY